MRDYFIAFFLVALVGLSFYRPWFATFTYLYTDILQPQRLSYYLLRSVPINFWLGAFAVVMFLFDKKKMLRFGLPQALMLMFVAWFTFTSTQALIQDAQVWFKWDAAWKSVLFGGVFLPFVLSTRRRIEAVIILVVLCVALVTVSGAMKTLIGGGGYDNLRLIVNVNKGLYESSTIATVSMAVIPLTLYLYRQSPLVGRNWVTLVGLVGLAAAAVLIVVGTEARTGLICGALLAFMLFWKARRKLAIVAAAAAIAFVGFPFLPQTFIDRMATIAKPGDDLSASTRTEVWGWTLDFARDHPLGGGFRVSRLTDFVVTLPKRAADGSIVGYREIKEKSRAFHSSYFETLAEHGWPGLFLYVSIIASTLVGLARVRARFLAALPEDRWIPELAQALFRTVMVYAVGGLFVGIAFQTTLYTFLALAIALGHIVAEREAAEARRLGPLALRRRMGRASAPALAPAE